MPRFPLVGPIPHRPTKRLLQRTLERLRGASVDVLAPPSGQELPSALEHSSSPLPARSGQHVQPGYVDSVHAAQRSPRGCRRSTPSDSSPVPTAASLLLPVASASRYWRCT